MTPGTYRHERFMNVCFKVVSSYNGSNSLKVKGYWINTGYVNSWYIYPYSTYIEIQKTDLKYWSLVETLLPMI